MAFDCFLKVDSMPGESVDDKHKDEIELLSVNWGMMQSGTSGYGGGAGGGRVSMQDFTCTKRFDKASPKLTLACCNGEHIKQALMTIRKAGKEQQEYMKITLTDVLVANISAGHEFRQNRNRIQGAEIRWHARRRHQGPLGRESQQGRMITRVQLTEPDHSQ